MEFVGRDFSRAEARVEFVGRDISRAESSRTEVRPYVTARLATDVHEPFMRAALEQAHEARLRNEVPIGAVVVVGGEVVGRGFNHPIGSGDPTAHAEMVALREAARRLGNYRLTGSTLYVTVEPCLMCVGAMVHARIGTLVYGAREPKAGAVESTQHALEHPALNHRVTTVGGVLEGECRQVLQEFFRERRQNIAG